MKRWQIIIVAAIVFVALAGVLVYKNWVPLYCKITSRGLNAKGGDITIINAKIWTGDPHDPWKSAMTVRDGTIIAMDADRTAGKVIDAEGRLIVPGFWDSHCHPQAPYILISPEAPMLHKAESVEEIQRTLQTYITEHPEDKFPRLFGWMEKIFKEGERPTRQMIDEVISDRPVYLVNYGGHAHWANTKALELAGALEKDPPYMCGNGHIERDPTTGQATGYLEETEYAATHGVLLNTVKKVKPFTFYEQVLVQRLILEEYSKVGVTSIWTKDGDIDITRIYEQILRDDALPVRTILDNMYTPYSKMNDLSAFAARAQEIEDSDLPKGFLRADVVKLFIDLPVKGWIWVFEPYADGSGDCGQPAFDLKDFRAQMLQADSLGLQINVSVYGDRALNECLNLFEETAATNLPRQRRHTIEHAEYVQSKDLPRFKELGITASMNPIGSYPDPVLQDMLKHVMGEERLASLYQRYKDLITHGALVVNGSDFPLAPMDPIVGMHILVNGTDIQGQPEGGLWPHKQIGIEDALRTYTVNAAYAAFEEGKLGMLKVGYEADCAMLSENILDPSFAPQKLLSVKVMLTVFNGHVVYEDFTGAEKVIDFGN